MNERFVARALPLCGKICRALGWRPAEFWQATPAELHTVLASHEGSESKGLTRAEVTAMLEQDSHE